MSKKLLATSLAALSLSLFATGPVLAEGVGSVTEPVPTEGSSGQAQGLEQLLATAQSLLAKLDSLQAHPETLPVTPENRQFLQDTITEINGLLDAMAAQGATRENAGPLLELRANLFKLYLLQYETPDLYTAILSQVPTLETKRFDDAVDFHDFDAELDDLLGKVSYLSQILAFVQADLPPEDFAKDKAYLTDVAIYLLKLQEELYAAEGETVLVPEAPVYWNAAAVPVTGDSGTQSGPEGTGNPVKLPESGELALENPSSGTQSGSEGTGSSAQLPDPGELALENPSSGTRSGSEDSGNPVKLPNPGELAPENPSSGTQSGSEGTGSSAQLPDPGELAPKDPSSGTQSGSEGTSNSAQSLEPGELVLGSTSPGHQSGLEKIGSSAHSVVTGYVQSGPSQVLSSSEQPLSGQETGKVPQTPPISGSGQQPVTSTGAVVSNQTRSVLPATGDSLDGLYMTAGLLLASLGLANLKRRQA